MRKVLRELRQGLHTDIALMLVGGWKVLLRANMPYRPRL